MKSFIKLSMILVCAICLGFGAFVSQSEQNVDLSMCNVEALASGEGSGSCKWATRETWQGWQAICIDSGVGYDCNCGESKDYF